DSLSHQIKKVQAIEALGAEVLIASADVANLQKMQQVIMIAEERFGQLNGVIHAAGIMEENSTVKEISQTDCERQFQSKVHGTLVLEKVLQNRSLDFCLLLSHLSSVLGGLGFVAYSAANIFMDAFVYRHNQINPTQWFSINWDGWQSEINPTLIGSWGASLADLAILPEEGINAFQRIFSSPREINQLVVSTSDLQARIDQLKRDSQKPEKSNSLSS
ncbi:Polyketide synthase, KR domain protein, partial [Candidatus Thiomargarita nelsonii]